MKFTFTKLDYREPAVLRGILGAVLTLAGSIGVTSNADLPTLADAAIIGGFTVWPVIQGLLTRAVVWSRHGKEEAVEVAKEVAIEEFIEEQQPPAPTLNNGDEAWRVKPQTPGVGDHADDGPRAV